MLVVLVVCLFRYLVDKGAPNTAPLVTIGTTLTPQKCKPVHAVLLADFWVEDERERAACQQAMKQAGIKPMLL